MSILIVNSAIAEELDLNARNETSNARLSQFQYDSRTSQSSMLLRFNPSDCLGCQRPIAKALYQSEKGSYAKYSLTGVGVGYDFSQSKQLEFNIYYLALLNLAGDQFQNEDSSHILLTFTAAIR